MDYEKTLLKEEIVIKRIISIHYFEYAKDYVFEGEKHDFWEFLYVDKGEVEVMAEALGLKLKQGEIIFHKPNEFHNVWANGKVAPNLIVVSFECKSPAIRYYENKILGISDFEKNLLAQIINEAKEAYTSELDITHMKKLEKRPEPIFGCEQLIKIYLEQLLISMVRKGNSVNSSSRLSTVVKERSDNDLLQRINNFLNENVTKNLTFDEVCRFSNLSRTSLKVLFKDKMGTGVMEHFKKLKIEAAKKMMREGEYNFTQISEILGYTSIHYFSRHFKNVTGMTPSQYVLSVKSKAYRI
ncbi:AraC-like DNA-binding protein [Ruminiclostridium sufflavum DSM 19573]|uniref:AraC-like DNA-binding protein n=1 Tax=Ruminiclostridium sufflavum DSM 19573 TaxID=1121337 RepID=A0A318XP53_9FIRM|nr:AraC family transcriptional regulator [Ruminiclostridium sufflavum]PYG88710.1 AraC-like DNA-binding protein [Ruminiclostridium sufflavum DSM 19573]